MKAIGIIGCGWLGSKLAKYLAAEFEIWVTTRTQQSADSMAALGYSSTVVEFSEDKDTSINSWNVVSQLDSIVVAVPFSIRRATPESLRFKMNNLCRFIGGYDGQLFFTSSTGVYPRRSTTFTEADLPINDNATEYQMKQAYPKVNILRLAGLMGDNRLLHKYKVTNLDHPVNHIHYEDACSVIFRMIEAHMHGKLFNLVAPQHPTKREVIQAQLGDTEAPATEAGGRIISSAKLIAELDFDFRYPDPRTFHKKGQI